MDIHVSSLIEMKKEGHNRTLQYLPMNHYNSRVFVEILKRHSLRTMEMMLIPAMATPVRNRMMTNITYVLENELTIAKNMVAR